MNAKKLQSVVKTESKAVVKDSPLKFLSPFQKRKSASLSKEWKAFNYGLFGEIINKI